MMNVVLLCDKCLWKHVKQQEAEGGALGNTKGQRGGGIKENYRECLINNI